ncbi:hypothetical protein O1L55_32235 [Streptomyces albulus]|nr:hypothetical protein [Streptomyces noursei]
MLLFSERAAAVRPGFDVDERNLGDVLRVVRSLDGLPLALELAAARLRTLSLSDLAAGLSDRFRLLTTGSRTAAPRHRTLRAVIAWSWDLLGADARTVAERIAVLPGGVTPASATAVCAGTAVPADEVRDLLADLVDRSLLHLAPDTGRYRMLETIREYGLERLAEEDTPTDVRDLAARHFAELVARQDPLLRGPEQLDALHVLHAEYDNVLAALRHLHDTGDADRATGLAVNLIWCWRMLGRHADAAYWLGAAVALPVEQPSVERDIAEGCCCSTSRHPEHARRRRVRGTGEELRARRPPAQPPGAAGRRRRPARDPAGRPGRRRRTVDVSPAAGRRAGPVAGRAGPHVPGPLRRERGPPRSGTQRRARRPGMLRPGGRPLGPGQGTAAARCCGSTTGPRRRAGRPRRSQTPGPHVRVAQPRRRGLHRPAPHRRARAARRRRASGRLVAAARERARRSASPELAIVLDAREAGLCVRTGDLERARELVESAEAGLSEQLPVVGLHGRALVATGTGRTLPRTRRRAGRRGGTGPGVRGCGRQQGHAVRRDGGGDRGRPRRAPRAAPGRGRPARRGGTAAGAHDRTDPQVRALSSRSRRALGDDRFAEAYRAGWNQDPAAALAHTDPARLRCVAPPSAARPELGAAVQR